MGLSRIQSLEKYLYWKVKVAMLCPEIFGPTSGKWVSFRDPLRHEEGSNYCHFVPNGAFAFGPSKDGPWTAIFPERD